MESISQSTRTSKPMEQPFSYQIKHIPLKRIFDILFSISFLILFFPFILLIMIFLKATSKGKILYAHPRVGRGGKIFNCYKFRTMHQDADKRLKNLLISNSEFREEWNTTFKLKNDPRVTSVGKFLRRTSLDELPQFWNVLKGDLSVVGPRPVIQEEIDKHFGIKAYKILSIRPGLTGIWQVSGRSDISYETRIKLDEHYVDHQTLRLDMTLVLKTIPCMINSKGAY